MLWIPTVALPDHLLAENERLKQLLEQKEQLIAQLKAQIDWLNRQKFATGKSEKLDRAQLLLQLEELEGKLEELDDQPVRKISYEREAPKPRKRQDPAEHFANLPVDETIVIDPPEVQANPELYEKIGEERTFEPYHRS